MSNHLETIGKLDKLVQIPDIKVSEAELQFLAFYRLFPPASSDKDFLSFKGSRTSDLSFLDGDRVTVHDIMDHVGAGRITNNYDNVESFEIIPDLDKNFGEDVTKIKGWVQDNVNIYKDYLDSGSLESFKDYYFRSSTKKNIQTSGSRRYIDEMTGEDWEYLFHRCFQAKQAMEIYNLEIKNLKEKIPTIQDAVLEENAILNQTFKENPEYFDVAKNSNEYRKLLDEQETLTRRIQSKVNILLKKLTPFESQRVLLLKKLKIWELRNGYSKLHGNGSVDYNQCLDLTRDQFTKA